MITPIQLIKEQLKNAQETFEGTVADIKDEHLHKHPGGSALPLAAAYAHLVFSEDVIVHSMLQGSAPLYETTFKDKTGANKIMPPMDENWSTAHAEWANTVALDLPKFKEYASNVFADTEKYVNTLSDSDLEKEIDLGSWGKRTLAYMLYAFIIAHTNSLAGEISAVKGVHGEKGYAF